jgi:hemolysin III
MTWFDFREPVSAWTHFLWLILSLPGTYVLVRLSRGDRVKQLGMLTFGLGLAVCYAGSTLFHAVRLSNAAIHHFNTLDHVGIYVLIACTATPIALVVLRGAWRAGLLTSIWILAVLGIVLCVTEVPMPRWLSTAYYLLMGWIGCATYFELTTHLSHRAVRPIWIGGLLYSVGALIHLADWPNLAPDVFGAHELFHLFVMGGSLCHYYFMLAVLVPYRYRPPAHVQPAGEPALPLARLARQTAES